MARYLRPFRRALCRAPRSFSRLLLLPLLLLPFVFPLSTAAQESFDDAVAVTVVEVPVQVISNGRPVTGLSAEDFEVYDDGERREISTFEVIDFSTVSAPASGAPEGARRQVSPRERRNLLLLFDFTFSEAGRLKRAHEGALEMVREQLGPRDRAAVGVYGNPSGTRLLTNFTSDREALELALGVVGAALARDAEAELQAWSALNLHLYGTETAPGEIRTLSATLGSRGALALTGSLGMPSVDGFGTVAGAAPGEGAEGVAREARDSGGAPSSVDGMGGAVASEGTELTSHSLSQIELGAVKSLAEGLGELAALLAPIEGQNHLFFFSEGFSNRFLTGDLGVQSATPELRSMVAEFRRANWSIHAIDVRGTRPRGTGGGGIDGFTGVGAGTPNQPAETAFGQDSLLQMAKDTGGELYENFNRMEQATAQALERTRVTYLLTFTPGDLVANGEYRNLEVKVKGAGLTARVVHRPGYYAPKPAGERSALDERLAAADEILGATQRSDLPATVMAAALPRAGGGAGEGGEKFTRVPVLIEVPGSGLAAPSPSAAAGDSGASSTGELPLRVQAFALDDRDTIVDFLAQDLRFDLARVGERLERSGVRIYGELALPPGVYRLRVRVEEGIGGRQSLTTLPMVVDGEVSEVELLPPLFLDLAGDWVMARASTPGTSAAAGGSAKGRRAAQPAQPDYPFTMAGREIVPALAPELPEGSAAAVVLLARAPEEGDVRLITRILGADGKAREGGTFELQQRLPAEDDGYERMVARFAPEGLAPGDYSLEITLVDADTGERSTRRAGFTVPGEG